MNPLIQPLLRNTTSSEYLVWEGNDSFDVNDFKPENYSSGFPLGKIFELLVLACLEKQKNIQIITHDEQVIIDKVTVGSPDILFKDIAKNETIHAEIAFKIFLLNTNADSNDLSQWIGINNQDNLKKKWDYLLSTQLNLLDQKKCLDFRLKHSIHTYKKLPIFCGLLFLHFKEWYFPYKHKNINFNCVRGIWCTMNELSEIDFSKWQQVNKKQLLLDKLIPYQELANASASFFRNLFPTPQSPEFLICLKRSKL